MISIRFDMRGIAGAIRSTLTVMHKLENREPALERIKREQIMRWIENYAGEGSEYGGWKGLSGMTLAERSRMGYGAGPILQRSGGTFRDVIAQSDDGKVSNTMIDWVFRNRYSGRGAPYPVSHDSGYTSPLTGGAVPARTIWDLDGEDEQRAADLIEEYVDQIISAHF
jgi:hypothetical protein